MSSQSKEKENDDDQQTCAVMNTTLDQQVNENENLIN